MAFIVGPTALTSPSGTTLSVDGSVNVMNVNANGILTRPQTPFMRGQLSGKGSYYTGGGGNLLITVDQDVNGNWNSATGIWTSPVPGFYMVTLGNIASSEPGYINIMKNGVSAHFTHWNHAGAWHYVSLSAVVPCNALDTIHFIMTGPVSPTGGFYGAGGHGMYSIALMV